MTIAAGDTVGSFQILSELGHGGMGEVFRARDSRLGRDVALKFLHVDWASDPKARIRFEREARSIAALSHPGIGSLYDIGEHNGSPYLVMECVEGQTLARRLGGGALPLAEAMRIGSAIAEALAFAHRAGIVHRDLKPSNVMLTRSGVKLLDFGLAKVTRANEPEASTAELTEPHAVLGTLPYMAPEQVRGGDVDARADIFAFGAVLFEMVSGRRLFNGVSSAEIASAVLRDEPARLEPPALDRVIRRCLAKDADDRWQSIQDVGAQLGWVSAAAEPPLRASRHWLALAVSAAVVIAAAVVAWPGGILRPDGARTNVDRRAGPAHASITLGRGQRFVAGSRPSLSISRDGTRVAFVARQDGMTHLFVRRFSEPSALSLGLAAGGGVPTFFSPDGQWIGFVSSNGRLSKVAVTGGEVVALADISSLEGAVWTADGQIVFAPASEGPLWIVPAAGGAARPLTRLDDTAGEQSHRWPFTLPDGRIGFAANSPSGARLVAFEVRDGQQRVLIENAAWGTYLADGRLMFSRHRQLYTVSTNRSGDPSGADPVIVAAAAMVNDVGVPYLAASDSGDMIFYSTETDPGQRSLIWVDQNGRPAVVGAPPRAYQWPAIAPDGRTAALSVASGAATNVWSYDFSSQALTALTTDGRSAGPFAWSPDSRELMYGSLLPLGLRSIRRLNVGAPGVTELVFGDGRSLSAISWLRNGRVTIHRSVPQTSGDVMMLDLSDRRVTPLVERPGTQWSGRVSADGAWLAFVSNESGRFEAMVARLSEPTRQWQVSLGGGQEVGWSRNGLELYYRTEAAMMAATIDPTADPPIRGVRKLFDNRYVFDASIPGVPNYDVAADGRFLMIAGDDDPNALTLRVVFNWAAGLAPSASSR